MLIEDKPTLRLGDTLVPWSVMFDGTNLSNFACDMNQWPVYITIGNLCSTIRQMPSTHTVVMVALLPNPNMNRDIPQKRLDEQWQTN